MSIHIGAEGVVRQVKGLALGHHWGVYETPMVKCGVEGVVRDLLDITDRIDHVEVSVENVYVSTVDSNEVILSEDGEDLATLNRYGSLTLGTNYIQLSCTTSRKRLQVNYTIYVVYKDGLKSYMSELIQTGGVTYALSVTGYEYFSTDGWYQNYCLGSEVVSGSISGSSTQTITLRDVALQTSGYIVSALKSSGTNTGKQTFNSIRINGQNIPITVVNNLT